MRASAHASSTIRLGLLFVIGLFIVHGFGSHWAYGTLGESAADSLEKDRSAMSGIRRSAVPHSAFSVHEINSDATNVKEYVSPAGVVFAVVWKGQSHPDLNQLLGASYSAKYREALRNNSSNTARRHQVIKTSQIVVERWGHMRNLQGRAYDPSLIPARVSINEIR